MSKSKKQNDDFECRIRPKTTEHKGPVGFCIYCGKSNRKLSKEHVIPYWMAGAFVLDQASCDECAEITKRFETDLSYTAFFGLRRRLRVQSRSNGGPRLLPVKTTENGIEVERMVSVDEMPAFLATWAFQPPGILMGRPPNAPIANFKFSFSNLTGLVQTSPRLNGTVSIKTDPVNHLRLAAKIALGMFYFARDQVSDYEPILSDVVRTGQFAQFLVGGRTANEHEIELPIDNDGKHALHYVMFTKRTIPGDNVNTYLVALVHLFIDFGGPRFSVVTARKRSGGHAVLFSPQEISIPASNGRQVAPDPFILHVDIEEHAQRKL